MDELAERDAGDVIGEVVRTKHDDLESVFLYPKHLQHRGGHAGKA